MHIYDIDLLKNFEFFSSFDDNNLRNIISLFEVIELRENEILFNRSDNSDYFYILVEGKLTSFLMNKNKYKVLWIHEPGEMVGELGAISGEPRTLSIKTLTKARILRSPSESIKLLCHNNPHILNTIIKTTILRSQNSIKHIAEKTKGNLNFLVAVNPFVPIETFGQYFSKISTRHHAIKVVTDLSNIDSLLKDTDELKEHVVVIVNSDNTHLISKHLHLANNIYFVVDNKNKNKWSKDVLQLLQQAVPTLLEHKLIVLHEDNVAMPTGTAKWLAKGNFIMHHHARMNNSEDYQRLLRFISGTPLGLVLSGGGAKGWAHIGVIKALMENNIKIDAVVGTSIGSVTAACLTIAATYEDLNEMFANVVRRCYRLTAWWNLSFPFLSLFKPKMAINCLKKIYNDIKIEDLWIPYICISANITQSKEEIHTSGELWKAIQASNALPGILPPVIINGQLHVDGGVVNNLPVDVLRGVLGPEALLITSNIIAPSIKSDNYYNFPENVGLKDIIAYKMGLKKYKIPSLVGVIYNSLLQSSTLKTQQNALLTDILLNPDTTKYSIFACKKGEEQKLIELGYQEAIKNNFLLKLLEKG